MSEVDYTELAQALVAELPDIADLEARPNQYWNQLQVWVERIESNLLDPDYVRTRLSTLGIPLLQAICIWTGSGLPLPSTKAGLIDALVERIVNDPTRSWSRDLFCLIEFVRNRWHDAIEMISKTLLPTTVCELIDKEGFDANSKRLLYAMQVYYQEPAQLRLLMLFERAERGGYTRYSLVPKAFEGDELVADEIAEQATMQIQQGVDLGTLSAPMINEVLREFEARRGGNRRSTCFGVHLMEDEQVAFVFIMRQFREAYIREVERTIFGDEAELIVLRLGDRLRTLEERSEKKIGAAIAGDIASHLLGGAKVEYLEDQTRTTRTDLERLIQTLKQGSDESLRLQEVYLRYAPIAQSPVLILRCEKDTDLSAPLDYLEQRNLRLLDDLQDIRNINVVYHLEAATRKTRSYIFQLFLESVTHEQYFVRYSQRGVPTDIRRRFERYLRENYNVRIAPSTR